MTYYLIIILGKRFMNGLVETEKSHKLIFYVTRAMQRWQVAVIPEETAKDDNTRITLKR
jgi:hypothetical protein